MRNQQNGRNPQAGQLSSPYQIRELKERLDSVEVDQESLKSQVDNVEKKAEESASGSGESGTNATFLYLRAQDGPAIKNNSGSVTFDIMKVEGNDSADVYQGSDFDIRNYDPTKSGASGQNFGQQVTLNASDIDGKQTLYLCVSDGSEVVDTDTAVDITDGQGGGYVEAVTPVTATYLQQDASFTISPLKVRGYFYKTGTTTNPEIARVQLYPTYDGSLKATYTKTKDLDSDGTSPISVSVQNQNGNALNEGQSATAKLAREVVVKFTYEDPNTSQTAVATETLYLTTETGPGDYVSYVFQRSDSQPSRPANSAGGTYNDPSVPTDWSDAPPVGEKRLWLSKATYEYASDGPVDTDEDGNVWSTPVRLKGEDSGLFTLFASKPKPTDPDKTNISGRPGSTTWSGSSDWKTTPNDLSTDAYYMARAVWKNESWQSFDVTRIKGEKGDAAQIVRIDASSQVFTLQKDGTHAPSSITLRAVQQNIDNPTFEWTYNGSTTQSTNVSILPEDLGEDGTVSVTLSEVGTSNSDEITLVRVTEGADASIVVLSNQNHTYPADQDGNVDSSLFSKGASEIEAYVGASRANVLQSRLGAASASQKGGTTTSGFAHVLYDGSASNLGLSSGDDVAFVGEIRTAQNTSQSGRLLVEFWDGSGGKISDIKSDLENSTEWQSLSTNGAVPTGTNRIVLGYAVESVSSGNEQLVEGRYGSIHKSTQPLPAYNAYISETNINGSVDRSQPQTISYEPSGSMTNDRASALVTFKIVREDGEVEARDKQIEYSKARAGTDSEVLSLSASSQVFAVNKSGNVSTQNPISLLVNRQNISSSVTWKTKNADGTDSPVTLTSKSDSLAELSYSDLENAGKQQVTVRAEADGYSDEVTIAIVREGKDAVTALLSNENHSYSASSDGSISDPSTGATTLSVYEGANKLSGGGGTPGFSVSVTKNNVSGSYSGGTFTPSGMSASEGSVNFEITVTKSDGSTQTINKTATYSVVTDGASASSVSIEAESQVFRVSKSGSVSPSQIGLNSVKQNVSSVSWSASDNVSFDGTPKSGYDQSVSKSSLDANEVGQVSITASGGGDSDTLTLAIIREGSDALTPILTNENHTFTAASDGTIAGSEYSSGATDVKIYEGATQLSADSTSNPSNGTFNVSSVTTTNINASKTENASSFTISPSGGMDNSESASIDITIDVVKQNGDEATITKTVTYSKSVAGADGSDAKAVSLSAQSQIFAVNQSDSVTTVNPIEFTANKENISSGFSWSTFNTNGNDSSVTLSSTNGNTATLSYSDLTGASEKEVTVRASAGGLFDEITVSIVEDGTDAVTVLLSNENHTYQAQSDGTVPDYSTGKTTIKVYRGDSQLSVGSDFSVSKSESNVSGNLVDAVYTPTGMSSGEGSVEFTVTVNKVGGGTETFTKTATYSKSIAGEDNQDFDFLGVDKSKIKDTAGLYTNNDFLGYFRDDANGSLNPNERARAYLDNSGNFYLNDENENTGPGLVYESNLSGGNGIFAVGDIGEAKDYHQGNSVSSSSSFLSYSKTSSNSELVFKGEIDAFGRIESFNPGGELAVRIDNDETFNTPTSSNNQSDSSFTLSSSGDSTTTSVSIESGTNEVTITISGDAGYFEIGGGDNQFEGGTYDIPSSMQVELKASSSGALLTEEWLQINESSVSGKTVSVSFDGQGHAGENIEIVVSNVYANNGNISLNGITVKSYTPTTEINARGVQVAYTSTDYVRIGASGITSTGGIETGSGAGVNFTSEGKLYADGSALYWSSGSNLTRIDSKVVEGTSGDSDKLDGNHGSYYLDASNINAGTLGTSYVPNLSASKITSGTLGTGRIPNLDASKITSGTLGTSRIPNLDASKITSGTFDAARIPSSTQYSDSDAVSAIESSIGSSSLVAQPASSGGSAEIRFKSNVNAGSDFGLLKWYDDNDNYNTGSGSETGVIALETENDDPGGGIGDHVVLNPTGHVYLDTDDEIRKGDSDSYNVLWHDGNGDAKAVNAIESTRINSLRLANEDFDTNENKGVIQFDKSAGLAYYNDAYNAPSGDLSGTDATKWHRVLDTDVLNTGSELTLSRNGTENQVGLSIDSEIPRLSDDETVSGSWTFEQGVYVEGGIEFGSNLWGRLQTASGFGPFTSKANNDVVMRNTQGSINQTLFLGDTGQGDQQTIFGIAHNNNAIFDVKGDGKAYLNGSYIPLAQNGEEISGKWRFHNGLSVGTKDAPGDNRLLVKNDLGGALVLDQTENESITHKYSLGGIADATYGADALQIENQSDDTDLLRLYDTGNVSIPNGKLNIEDGQLEISTNIGDVLLFDQTPNANVSHKYSLGGSTTNDYGADSFQIENFTDNLDLLRLYDGGTVEIPNGRLVAQKKVEVNGPAGDTMIFDQTANGSVDHKYSIGGTTEDTYGDDTLQIENFTDDFDILRLYDTGNVALPSGSLYIEGGVLDFRSGEAGESRKFDAKDFIRAENNGDLFIETLTPQSATAGMVFTDNTKHAGGLAYRHGGGTPNNTLALGAWHRIDLRVSGDNGTFSKTPRMTIDRVKTKYPDYIPKTSNWQIRHNGKADFRRVYTDELVAKSFVSDITQALAGSDFLTKSVATLAEDFTIPSQGNTGTIRVNDLPGQSDSKVFGSGDYVRLRVVDKSSGGLAVVDAWGTVTSYTDKGDDTQTWTFTREDGDTAADGKTVGEDGAVLDYGTDGQGIIRRTVEGDNTLGVVETWSGDPISESNYTQHLVYGDLSNVSDGSNEVNPEGWGLYTENGYFRGEIAATSGDIEDHLTVGPNVYIGQNIVSARGSGAGPLFIGAWQEDGSDPRVRIENPDNSYAQVELYGRDGANWGLSAEDNDGTEVVHLGAYNEIAGWSFTDTHLLRTFDTDSDGNDNFRIEQGELTDIEESGNYGFGVENISTGRKVRMMTRPNGNKAHISAYESNDNEVVMGEDYRSVYGGMGMRVRAGGTDSFIATSGNNFGPTGGYSTKIQSAYVTGNTRIGGDTTIGGNVRLTGGKGFGQGLHQYPKSQLDKDEKGGGYHSSPAGHIIEVDETVHLGRCKMYLNSGNGDETITIKLLQGKAANLDGEPITTRTVTLSPGQNVVNLDMTLSPEESPYRLGVGDTTSGIYRHNDTSISYPFDSGSFRIDYSTADYNQSSEQYYYYFFEMQVSGVGVEGEVVETMQVNGSLLVDGTVEADKLTVDDLNAIDGATIAGWEMNQDVLYKDIGGVTTQVGDFPEITGVGVNVQNSGGNRITMRTRDSYDEATLYAFNNSSNEIIIGDDYRGILGASEFGLRVRANGDDVIIADANKAKIADWRIDENTIYREGIGGSGKVWVGDRRDGSDGFGFLTKSGSGEQIFMLSNTNNGRVDGGMYANGGSDEFRFGTEGTDSDTVGVRLVADDDKILEAGQGINAGPNGNKSAFMQDLAIQGNAVIGGQTRLMSGSGFGMGSHVRVPQPNVAYPDYPDTKNSGDGRYYNNYAQSLHIDISETVHFGRTKIFRNPNDSGDVTRTIKIIDRSDNSIVGETDVTISPGKNIVNIDIAVSPERANTIKLQLDPSGTGGFWRSDQVSGFYTDDGGSFEGSFAFSNSSAGTNFYYYFWDLEVSGVDVYGEEAAALSVSGDAILNGDLFAQNIEIDGSLQSKGGDTVFNSSGIKIAAGSGDANRLLFANSDFTQRYGSIYTATDGGVLRVRNQNGDVELKANNKVKMTSGGDDVVINDSGGDLILKGHKHGEGPPSKDYAVYVDSNGYLRHTDEPTTNEPPNPELTGSGFTSGISWDATQSTDPNGDDLEFRYDFTDNGSYDTSWTSESNAGGTQYHDYGNYNTKYYCRVQVRDSAGNTANVRASAYTGDDPNTGTTSPTELEPLRS